MLIYLKKKSKEEINDVRAYSVNRISIFLSELNYRIIFVLLNSPIGLNKYKH
jgi:hypothetical protein